MAAPRRLWRYLFLDILVHALLGVLAITLLLVVVNLLRFVELLAAADVGLSLLARLVLEIVPAYGPFALPTALLFGILLSLGRMSADGEIVAMRASGISPWRLMPPAVALGVLATLGSAYLLFEIQPKATLHIRALLRSAVAMQVIEPGRFLRFGDRLLYVHSVSGPDCPLEGVLIMSAGQGDRSSYAVARCGTVDKQSEEHQLSFDLHDGSIHFHDPDPARYRRILFQTMKTEVDASAYADPNPGPSQLTFSELLAAERRAADDPGLARADNRYGSSIPCQIQRRLAFPFASLLLALVAVPLGIQPVRSGRSAGALTAIGVMALYWLLFSLGDMAAFRGVVPIWVGYWTPNAMALWIGIVLMRRVERADG